MIHIIYLILDKCSETEKTEKVCKITENKKTHSLLIYKEITNRF